MVGNIYDYICDNKQVSLYYSNIFDEFEYAKFSIPMALLIWLMIYLMMMKVDFKSIKDYLSFGLQIIRKDGFQMNKKKIAFICVHNSCRSQIAEALARHFASDVIESYSAGTIKKPQINQTAV